jgi:hypothetical protein
MLYKEVNFELGNSDGVTIFSTDLDATLIKAEAFIDLGKIFLIV